MTPYELAYLALNPFLPALYRLVKFRLKAILKTYSRPVEILDIGGRKSPYTIGLQANVTILDLPRRNEIQQQFNLGVNQQILTEIRRRRSNIKHIVLEDITQTTLSDGLYDCAVAVEVIEHVIDARTMIKQTHRILKPGSFFLLTTPNADHPTRRVPTGPKDHHFFTKVELENLLSEFFPSVEVVYAVPVGRFFSWGLKSWSIKRPKQTLQSMLGNLINNLQSANEDVQYRAVGTRQLIAIAQK